MSGVRNKQLLQAEIKSWKDVSPLLDVMDTHSSAMLDDWRLALRMLVLLSKHLQ